MESGEERKPLGLYIHIPFCVKKCAYCDFLSAPAAFEARERYVEALCREIEAFAPRADGYEVTSIFLGGGTPTVLEKEQLTRIMESVRTAFPHIKPAAEVTAECNPGTAAADKLTGMREAGFNRLSIGIQSADDEKLALLGRIHTWEEGKKSFLLARSCGFDNINLDLIYALPGQTPENWMQTLKEAVSLEPEHISAYSLIIEEGTLFYERYGREDERRRRGEKVKDNLLPREEEEQQMSRDTVHFLSAMGYERYEISNYALKGYACVHNTGYWTRREYAGFGIGAASLLGHRRVKNIADPDAYIKIWSGKGCKAEQGLSGCRADENRYRETAEETAELSLQDEMEETMFLGLRMTEGVSLKRFEERFGEKLVKIYEAPVRRYLGEGLMVMEDGFLRLTSRGMEVSNIIMADFLL